MMRFSPRVLTSVAALAVTCAVSVAVYCYKNRRTVINEVMIFCKLQYNVFNYFDKLFSYIESANESVSVCMPTIHNPAIQGRLVQLIKRKKIRTRIIIDSAGRDRSPTASFLEELMAAGAEIKCKIGEFRMQHKFCLVDDGLLLTGTLDWGCDLSWDSWNYVYITSKPPLVARVRDQFYQLWNDASTQRLQAAAKKDKVLDEYMNGCPVKKEYDLLVASVPEIKQSLEGVA